MKTRHERQLRLLFAAGPFELLAMDIMGPLTRMKSCKQRIIGLRPLQNTDEGNASRYSSIDELCDIIRPHFDHYLRNTYVHYDCKWTAICINILRRGHRLSGHWTADQHRLLFTNKQPSGTYHQRYLDTTPTLRPRASEQLRPTHTGRSVCLKCACISIDGKDTFWFDTVSSDTVLYHGKPS